MVILHKLLQYLIATQEGKTSLFTKLLLTMMMVRMVMMTKTAKIIVNRNKKTTKMIMIFCSKFGEQPTTATTTKTKEATRISELYAYLHNIKIYL